MTLRILSRTLLFNIAGLSVLFVALNWNSFNMPLERDEGEYAYSAWLLRDGGVPYRDSFLQKPPMIVYTYAIGQMIDPNALWPPRMLAAIFSVLTAIVTGLIAAQLYGKRAGWLVAWISLPLSMLPPLLPYAANTEKFLLLPMVVCLYIFVHCGTRANWWQWILAGMSAAAAVLFKPIAVLPLLVLFVAWYVETWYSERRSWVVIRRIAFSLIGALFLIFCVIAYFVFNHAFRDLIDCTVTYNYYYARAREGSIRFLPAMLWSLFSKSWPAVLLLALYLFKRRSRWILMSSLLLAALASASTDTNGHYYQLVIPFLAITSGSGLDLFLQWILTKMRDEKRRKSLSLVVSATVVAVLVFPLLGRMVMRPKELCSAVYRGNPFVESEIVARHVRESTSGSDSIFVAGSEPQILFYAKRKSVTRFDIVYPLTIPTPLAQHYQKELESTLKNSPPTVVVFARSGASWVGESNMRNDCINIVKRSLDAGNYRVVGGYVRSKTEEGWEEPLRSEDIGLATLIVFRHERSGPT